MRIRYIFFLIAGALIIFNPALALADADHLVISQVQITGEPGKTSNDFVEIYNPTSADLDLKGLRLVKRTKTGATDTSLKSWTDTAIVHAHGFYLWANSSFTDIAMAADATTTGSVANDNGVALRNGPNDTGAIIDSVAWGEAANSFIESSVFAANPAANQSLERNPGADAGNGTDANNNASDFFLQTAAHPRNSQSAAVPPISVVSPVPEPTPEPVSTPSAPPPPVYSNAIVISELLPNPDGTDSGEEWVELFNNSAEEVDLAGWILDDEGPYGSVGSSAYVLPAPSIIQPLAFFLITMPEGSFALNNSGSDMIRLFWPDKNQFSQASYDTAAKEDYSFARKPDGTYAWTNFLTKGGPNQFMEIPKGVSSEAATKIKINEIFPNPKGADGGGEWIEVINIGTEPVYIHNWILDDGSAADKIGTTAWKIPGPIVGPGGFAVLAIPGGKFSLNNTDDTVRLFNENQFLIDSVAYADAKEDQSYALVAGEWAWIKPTPNAANEILEEADQAITGLVINEIFPEPEKSDAEFIELFNQSESQIDLAGFILSDASTDYKLPAVNIGPGEFLAVRKIQSGIALNNSGKETVTLTDLNGHVIWSVEYEDAPKSQSYNLLEDGAYAWSSVITAGENNQIEVVVVETKKPVKKAAAKKSTVLAKAVSAPVPPEVLADSRDTRLSQPESFPVPSQIAGANVVSPSPGPASRNWLPWIIGSFALNLAFCYILVTLMLRKKRL